jgi:hypothetical protein
MKPPFSIFKEGRLSKAGLNISSAIGVGCAIGVALFLDDVSDWRLWALAAGAIFFGYGAIWSGLAQSWGLRPFRRTRTTDPDERAGSNERSPSDPE